MDVENKNVEPNMVKLAREIYMKKNNGNFNNFIYGRASGKFVGSKKKNKRIVR